MSDETEQSAQRVANKLLLLKIFLICLGLFSIYSGCKWVLEYYMSIFRLADSVRSASPEVVPGWSLVLHILMLPVGLLLIRLSRVFK